MVFEILKPQRGHAARRRYGGAAAGSDQCDPRLFGDAEEKSMQIIKTALKLWLFLMTMMVTSFPADAQQLRKVPVGIPAIGISSGSFIVAKEAGFYREEGLDVELVVMRGAPAIQGLIGGTVPFASSGGAGMLPIVRGAPLRIMYTTFYRPMFWLYSKAEIRTIDDLRGKKIGVSSIGSGPDSLLRGLLKQHNMDGGRDVIIVSTGAGTARFISLKTGITDAAVLNEQAALMAQESGMRQLFAFTSGDEFVEVQGSVVLRDSLVQTDPQLVEKFIRGTSKGGLYLKDNRPGSIKIHSRVLKVNENMASRIYDLARPGVTTDGTVSEELQKKAIDQILERTDVKEIPGPSKVFDFGITKKVYAELQAKGWKAAP
jgi:NitT/TauT family transport system substrate-binding protein